MADEIKTINVFGSDDSDKLKKSKLSYDQKFKQLFTNRASLAPILKNVIPEYEGCQPEQIFSKN